MKKTVLYVEIDGHKIITGFDSPTVDPVETNNIVNEAIKETAEYLALEAKKAEYNEAVQSFIEARKNKDENGYKLALSAMDVRQEELRPLARAYQKKITELRRANAVHFTPRKGEVIKAATEVKALLESINGRPSGVLIALDGSPVEDNRGKVFFRKSSGKWGRTKIVRLGDKIPADAVIDGDLTETQLAEIEADRISALPADLKLKEKEQALNMAMDAAVRMRQELEIQGDPDALQKTQDWHQAEVVRIEDLYK
jgi:hypothetical protein